MVNHIYHRMVDHPDEVKQGLGVGLRRPDKSPKPAWSRWALANRKDLSPPKLDCGYEVYACKVGNHSLVTTDVGCEGPQLLGPLGWAWKSAPSQGKPIYRCRIGAGQDHVVSSSATCEGQKVEQLLGYGLP